MVPNPRHDRLGDPLAIGPGIPTAEAKKHDRSDSNLDAVEGLKPRGGTVAEGPPAILKGVREIAKIGELFAGHANHPRKYGGGGLVVNGCGRLSR